MKVHPSNQTLILASERRPGTKAASALDQAISAASSGGSLRRVTIVASQHDSSLLYLQADFAAVEGDQAFPPTASRQAPAAGSNQNLATARSTATASRAVSVSPTALLPAYSDGRDEFGNSRGNTSEVSLSSYLKPAEQYAQTQRLLGTTLRPSYIDVLA